ncbi:MAG: hypothetical protein LBU62_11925 [Bacteroidales bacterium]|jgi:hypothetical protein|nr:hypothetical protein [Bacteroidales bacterium]
MKNIGKCLVLSVIIRFICLNTVCAQHLTGLELTFIGASAMHEINYNEYWAIQLKATGGCAFGGGTMTGNWHTAWYKVSADQRCYYNIVSRMERGKNTRYNSANFFSISPYFAYLPENQLYKERVSKYACTFNWGLRRSFCNRFYFDGSIGVGPAHIEHRGWQAVMDLNLNIGFILFNEKNKSDQIS